MFIEQRPELGNLTTPQERRDALVGKAVQTFGNHAEGATFVHTKVPGGTQTLFELAGQSIAGYEQAANLVALQGYVHE